MLAGRAPWVGGVLCVLLGALTAVVHIGPGVQLTPGGLTSFAAANATIAIVWGVTGAVVLRARPRHVVGRILLTIGLAQGVTGLSRELGLIAYDRGSEVAAAWLLWLGEWPFLLSAWFPLLLILLPDGRPPGRRWRPFVVGATLAPVPIAVAVALAAGPLLPAAEAVRGPSPNNPVGVADLGVLELLSVVLFLVSAMVGLASLVVRWRRGGEPRQQLKWIVLPATFVVIAIPVDIMVPHVGPVVAPVAVTLFAAAIGVAVARHRLLDIDVVISRTLLWAALTTTLVGLYVTVVTLVGAAVRGQGLLSGLVATALVAVAFAPLRSALQQGIDRLFFGLRDDPYAVLRRVLDSVDTTVSAEDVLPEFTRTLAGALRLPYAQVVLPGTSPTEAPPDVVALPLRHRGEDVGTLLVAPRASGERLSPADEQLLADLARQAAAAAHAVLLTAELRASRDRLVLVREDERHRLRRDLHDGLGPLLAAVTVQLDAARRLLDQDPPRAGLVLGEARREVQDAVSDVRRLIDGLRPAVLGELGLADAIRALASRLQESGTAVTVTAEDHLALSAPVELAVYRIVSEALSNAARHANAQRIHVQLACDGEEVQLVVTDDGIGIATSSGGSGVGLGSMRERAHELGGSLDVASGPQGTTVTARLPLAAGVPA